MQILMAVDKLSPLGNPSPECAEMVSPAAGQIDHMTRSPAGDK